MRKLFVPLLTLLILTACANSTRPLVKLTDLTPETADFEPTAIAAAATTAPTQRPTVIPPTTDSVEPTETEPSVAITKAVTAVSAPEVTDTVEPTAETLQPTETIEPTVAADEGLPPTQISIIVPTSTPIPEATSTSPPPTPWPTAIPTIVVAQPEAIQYFRVVSVPQNEALNVREFPGRDGKVIGGLETWQNNIVITGEGEYVGQSLWVPIEADGLTGWVNSYYIAQTINPTDFCGSIPPLRRITEVATDLAAENYNGFSELIHPVKGVTVQLAWWNPAVRVPKNPNPLFSEAYYDYGVLDGSGNRVEGTFSDIILPRLFSTFVRSETTACNEIISGPTAGIIKLPNALNTISYYSIHNPGDPDIEFDWSTWVVGLEYWEGELYVTYLIYYQYEI